MPLTTKNLGLVKAIHVGTTSPTNTKMIWYNLGDNLHYTYDVVSTTWIPLGGGGSQTLSEVLAQDNITGGYNISVSTGDKIVFNNGAFIASIVEPTLAASIVLTLPNIAGTFALLSDIPSYTFSTGLTNAANTITANLSTGVAGGQSAIGGTLASQNLTLSSTIHATKGFVYIGSSTKFAFDETNGRQGIGIAVPTNKMDIVDTNNTATYASVLKLRNTGDGANFTETGILFHSSAGATTDFIAGRIYTKYDSAFTTQVRMTFQSIGAGDVPIDTMSLFAGRVGVGITTPSTAKFQIVSTTEQFRSGYDDTSNYWKATTSSAGLTTFDAVGASNYFRFSKNVAINVAPVSGNALYVAGNGNTSATYTSKFINSSSVESLTIRDDGQIKNTYNENTTGTLAGFTITNTNAGSDAFTTLKLINDSSFTGGIYLNSSGATSYFGGANSLNILTQSASPLAFGTNSTFRAIITSAGLFGYGIKTPQKNFEIHGSNSDLTCLALVNDNNANGQKTGILFADNDGSGTSFYGGQSIIKHKITGAGAVDSNLEFWTSTASTLTQRFTIKENGALRVTPITATAASAITPEEGDMIFVSTTNGTFTTVGFWGYENGAWIDL